MPTLRSTRRRRVVLAIAATVILTSLGAIPAAAAEIVTPYVIATTPAEGEIDVAVGATLSVTLERAGDCDRRLVQRRLQPQRQPPGRRRPAGP